MNTCLNKITPMRSCCSSRIFSSPFLIKLYVGYDNIAQTFVTSGAGQNWNKSSAELGLDIIVLNILINAQYKSNNHLVHVLFDFFLFMVIKENT